MVMLETRDNENHGSEGGQYACSEEELYKKAIALLEKCKIEARRSGQKVPESTAETSPTTVLSLNREKSVPGRGAGRQSSQTAGSSRRGGAKPPIRPAL